MNQINKTKPNTVWNLSNNISVNLDTFFQFINCVLLLLGLKYYSKVRIIMISQIKLHNNIIIA